MKVQELCEIQFSFGKHYQDMAVCDVVEMNAYHILLGLTWQHDVDATYKGRQNVYVFE